VKERSPRCYCANATTTAKFPKNLVSLGEKLALSEKLWEGKAKTMGMATKEQTQLGMKLRTK